MKLKNPHSMSIYNPYAWLLVLIFVFTLIGVVGPLNSMGALNMVSMLVLIAVFSLVAWPIKVSAEKYGVRLANDEVSKLAAAVHRGESIQTKFMLYLRPHWLDGRDGYDNPRYNSLPTSPSFWLQPSRLRLDQFVSAELGVPVVAVGTREMRLATGSISVSDCEWKTIVATLIKTADCILYIPDSTAGMTWEFEEIEKQQQKNKVVFIQPPQLTDSIVELLRVGQAASDSKPNVAAKWSGIREHLKITFNLDVPEYQETGSAITIGEMPTQVATRTVKILSKRLRRLSGRIF